MITHEEIKSKLRKIPKTNLSDISLLLPDDYFDGELSNVKLIKPCPKSNKMFLGLNRSKPKEYNFPYHNMRDKIKFLLEDERIKNKLLGAYLSDFVKYKVLKKHKKVDFANGKDVIKKTSVRDKKQYEKILREEIKQFDITLLFCWGNDVWGLIKDRFGEDYKSGCFKEKVEYFQTKIGKEVVTFVPLWHYSCRKKEKINKIKREIKKFLSPD